jgi:hypothetical protein
MNKIEYQEIIDLGLTENAIINNEFIGFKEDYLILHSLIAKWKPRKIFEIGTCTGKGCQIMHNASPESEIITLDIVKCGELCPVAVKKIVNDSLFYDYSINYPIDCWFIDGNHIYDNVYKETEEAIKSNSKYIIYHDADIKEVYEGIKDSFIAHDTESEYNLYQVINPPYIYSTSGNNITRIAYAIKKSIS